MCKCYNILHVYSEIQNRTEIKSEKKDFEIFILGIQKKSRKEIDGRNFFFLPKEKFRNGDKAQKKFARSNSH